MKWRPRIGLLKKLAALDLSVLTATEDGMKLLGGSGWMMTRKRLYLNYCLLFAILKDCVYIVTLGLSHRPWAVKDSKWGIGWHKNEWSSMQVDRKDFALVWYCFPVLILSWHFWPPIHSSLIYFRKNHFNLLTLFPFRERCFVEKEFIVVL